MGSVLSFVGVVLLMGGIYAYQNGSLNLSLAPLEGIRTAVLGARADALPGGVRKEGGLFRKRAGGPVMVSQPPAWPAYPVGVAHDGLTVKM